MWRADFLCEIYRGTKRGHECVDDSDEQSDRKMSVRQYKEVVHGLFRILCSMPIGPTKTRYEYKHTIRNPNNPCAYVDIKMFIDIRPSGDDTMEVTFFRINDATKHLEEQIAHASLTTSQCLSKVEELLDSMFP